MRLKGITHIHTKYSSDGRLTIPDVADLLRWHKLQFAILSEHRQDLTGNIFANLISECQTFSDEQTLILHGVEYEFDKSTHILVINSDTLFPSNITIKDMLTECRGSGAKSILLHPKRGKFLYNNALLDLLDGIEVWNTRYDGKICPDPRVVGLVNKLCLINPKAILTLGMDLHLLDRFSHPIMELEADILDKDSIISALINRNCYISGAIFWKNTKIDNFYWNYFIWKFVHSLYRTVKWLCDTIVILIPIPKSVKQFFRQFI